MKNLALALFLVACAGPQKTGPAPSPAPAAADGVKQWVADVMTAYEHGDVTIYDARLDPDGFFVATDPHELWDAPKYIAAHHAMLQPVADGKMHWHLASRDLRVSVTPDGKGAWMSDLFDWDFGEGAQPLRWTAVFIQRDGHWLMSASHVSFAVPNDVAMKATIGGQLPAPGDVEDKVDADAKPLLDLFDKDLASPEQWIKDLTARPDFYLLGSAPDEVMTDTAAFAKELRATVGPDSSVVRRGAARAHVVPGGQLGWIIANVDVTFPNEGKKVTIPYRALAVYLQEGGAWKMVQFHLSNAVPNG